jgi:hypothetical protein
MFGIIFVHQIMSAANLRTKADARRRVYLYVDEFAKLVSTDFRFMLKEMRNFGVSLILAQQDLADLNIDEGQLLETMRNDPGIVACFGMKDATSARMLAEDLFLPQVTGLRVKYQHEKPVPWPIPKAEWVTSRTHGWGDSVGSTRGNSIVLTSSSEPSGILVTSFGDTHGTTSAGSYAASETTSLQRWVEFEKRMIQESPHFWTIDEELALFAGRIMRQTTGEVQLYYNPKRPPIPVETLAPGSKHFTPVTARADAIRRFRDYVYARMGAGNLATAEHLIEQRQQRVLSAGKLTPTVPTGIWAVDEAEIASKDPEKHRARDA